MVVSLGAVVLTTGFTNSNTGIIWLDQVQCTESESRLIDCPANPLENHDCSNFEDVGVRCIGLQSKHHICICCIAISFSKFPLKHTNVNLDPEYLLPS